MQLSKMTDELQIAILAGKLSASVTYVSHSPFLLHKYDPARHIEQDFPLSDHIVRSKMKKLVLVNKPKRHLELSFEWYSETL